MGREGQGREEEGGRRKGGPQDRSELQLRVSLSLNPALLLGLDFCYLNSYDCHCHRKRVALINRCKLESFDIDCMAAQ